MSSDSAAVATTAAQARTALTPVTTANEAKQPDDAPEQDPHRLEVVVEAVPLGDVLDDDFLDKSDPAKRFNTNNHWDNGVPPEDYDVIFRSVCTRRWIDAFHRAYSVLNIETRDLAWMQEASLVAQVTGKCSGLFQDELEAAVRKYDDPALFNGRQLFVRSESVSLKAGMHGAGPYKDLRSVLESVVTANSTHTPLRLCGPAEPLKLYFLPWRPDLNCFRELRVFVDEGRITAMSQQRLYAANPILGALPIVEAAEVAKRWARLVCKFYHDNIRPRLPHLASYVMDLTITQSDGAAQEDGVYFIEINPFGKRYSSGSSLFQWVVDEAKLVARHKPNPQLVHFRYTRTAPPGAAAAAAAAAVDGDAARHLPRGGDGGIDEPPPAAEAGAEERQREREGAAP